MRLQKDKMLIDTAVLSLFSVGLQGLGLLFNVFLTRRLGSAAVGEMTLMTSFYALAAVLSGGSGFVAVSRFLAEELGCGGDPARIFRYVLRFCGVISSSVTAILFVSAPLLEAKFPDAGCTAIRILCLSLPVSAFTGCLKGRCYAFQRVYVPVIAEYAEFIVRSGVLAFAVVFLLPENKVTVLTAYALSVLAGQGTAVIVLLSARIRYPGKSCICSLTVSSFLRQILPMIGNACLVAVLSTANDALVPLTLLQYGSSTEEALSQFGEFEAIIIPTLFFPSVVQCFQSALLVPELSRARAENRQNDIRIRTQRMLEQTVSYALFAVLIFSQFGGQIGKLLGGDAFTGLILRQMAPIVPFIYLEIILEGILRGLGKQNFSSVNYLAEYIVRISVLLICVPLFGFYGIMLSYIACNLSGNAVRLYFVLRVTGLKPVWKRILFAPFSAMLVCMLMLRICAKPQALTGLCAIPMLFVLTGIYWGSIYICKEIRNFRVSEIRIQTNGKKRITR